ncbi:hypothetical protein MPER_02574, partial [Moniliophthora perniciosa FA553]
MKQLLKKLLPGVDISNELENDSPEAPPEEEQTLPRNDLDEIEYKLEKLALEPPYRRYYGKASGLYLVETALQHKEQWTGKEVPKVPMHHAGDEIRYWEPNPMNALDDTPPTYVFPDEDLIPQLVELYFQHNASIYTTTYLEASFYWSARRGLGWYWMSQVPVVTTPRGKPALYDLQIYALAVNYFKA